MHPMSSPPIASVRVLQLPDLAEGCLRVEVECRFSTTGLTSIAADRIGLTVPVLITSACFAHEERCGECDTAQAHAKGDQAIRTATENAWQAAQAERARRYMAGRRN
jgi:hypothetical protein